MKHLIRNQRTRAYLMADGGWGDFESAELFPDVRDALLACEKHGITAAVDLVLILGQTPSEAHDVALPLFKNR